MGGGVEETLSVLDKRWRGACRVLFKEEVGGLAEFSSYLSELPEKVTHHQSNISGKDVSCAPTAYAEGSKFISFNEVDFNRKFESLNINEIKDIDSIVEALGERAVYSGNIVFGNSGHVEKSSNINDSFYLYEVARCGNSKYIAYGSIFRYNEDCFGSNVIGESAFCIRCNRGLRLKRCFELWMVQNSSDCYYSSGLDGCSECMFCFNVKNKRHAIGNLALEAAEYEKIKKKLLSEMAEGLRKGKKLPSLLDLVKMSRKEEIPAIRTSSKILEKQDKDRIEDAFSQTASILFGNRLTGGIDAYSDWLSGHTRPIGEGISAASGKRILIAPFANFSKLPADRIMTEEAWELGGRTSLTESEVGELSMKNAHETIGKLAYFNVDLFEGKNSNMIDCTYAVDSADCYKNSNSLYSKYCGYCFWPRNSQYLFGCDSPFDSAFSMHAYSCTQLTRCFEADCCGYCSDLYFGHNCENVHESMFCFNVKNRRYHIGNAEVEQGKYKELKASLLGQIHQELQKKKGLKWDIYNIWSAKK
jgi:hypothetical protein